MNIDPEMTVFLLGSVATISVSWGTSRANNASTKARAEEVKRDLKNHEEKDEAHQLLVVDRLARIETKLNMALGIKDEDSK